MAPTFGAIDISLSLRTTRNGRFRMPALLRPSKAMPPVRAPSPMTATTRRSVCPVWLKATAMPSAAEIEVEAWPGPEGVVLALVAREEAGQAALLADGGESVAPTRQQLVDVGLVADIPDDPVPRRREDGVESDRQLDRPERRAEVTAIAADHRISSPRISSASASRSEGERRWRSAGPAIPIEERGCGDGGLRLCGGPRDRRT
jgi:hypothetical protein